MNTEIMGVVNLTPNSFSDGGRYQSDHSLIDHLNYLIQEKATVLDIGGESTAPMNEAVGEKAERERLSLFIDNYHELLKKCDGLKRLTLSLDSFRVKNVQWFMEELLTKGVPEDKLIWNDVSGSLDDELRHTLKSFPSLRYIFCHNLAPVREKSGDHMDFAFDGDDLIGSMKEFFKPVIEEFSRHLILDPCFGFSKTLEQNLFLFSKWRELTELFPHWVFGVSKKSFLRESLKKIHGLERSKEESLHDSEHLHLLWLCKVLRNSSHLDSLYLRVHSPLVAQIALDWVKTQ